MMKNDLTDNVLSVYWNYKPISASRYGRNKDTGGRYYKPSYQKFRDYISDWVMENVDWVDNVSDHLSQFNTFTIEIYANFAIKNPYLWGVPHTKRPDGDNIMKAVQDEVSEAFGIDDMCFYKSSIEKKYAEKDSIFFVITGTYIDYDSIKKLNKSPKKSKQKKIKSRPRFELSDEDRKLLLNYGK